MDPFSLLILQRRADDETWYRENGWQKLNVRHLVGHSDSVVDQKSGTSGDGGSG